jgi:hypothetical protein
MQRSAALQRVRQAAHHRLGAAPVLEIKSCLYVAPVVQRSRDVTPCVLVGAIADFSFYGPCNAACKPSPLRFGHPNIDLEFLCTGVERIQLS